MPIVRCRREPSICPRLPCQRLDAERILQRGGCLSADAVLDRYGFDDPEDLDDAPEAEVEVTEEAFVDNATAARTITELEAEIAALERLEAQARAVRRLGTDSKWRELEHVLDEPLMTGPAGNRRKLIVFTEPRDTLTYLAEKIRQRLGRAEAVVIIHGGIGREDRRKIVEAFRNDPEVLVLVANDAAGEGVNLQRAHLMVNYDLPWNPKPHRAALRPHPPHRPDRGLPPVEPGRARDARDPSPRSAARIVEENCRALNFRSSGFEAE